MRVFDQECNFTRIIPICKYQGKNQRYGYLPYHLKRSVFFHVSIATVICTRGLLGVFSHALDFITPVKRVTGAMTLLIGIITPFVTGRGPSFRQIRRFFWGDSSVEYFGSCQVFSSVFLFFRVDAT